MAARSRGLPSGTVTFLFTDIEGSTRLLQQLGPRYDALLEEHRRLVRDAVTAEDGYEVNTEGDAFFIVFTSAARAAAAAVAAQRALAAFPWPDGAAIRVRMGLHTGEGFPTGSDYTGLDVHRAARVCAAAHGGQILASHATKALIEQALPAGASLRDLGAHRLKDLLRPEHLSQIVVAGLPDEFPPLRTVDVAPNNLPIQLTSFVGRERELTEARRLLDTTRLLTLTGPGGTGKTRLSQQLAADLIDQFPDGVYFVPLAPISDPDLVISTIAQTLSIRESGGEPLLGRLTEHLRDKRTLLLLDNFEQVLRAAPLVSGLLTAAPGVKVIVTSRAALHIYGEQEFQVPPLRLPDPRHLPAADALTQYEAVALFVQRAVAVKHDFTVTNENAPAVAEITSRLDGLPLAIELAAARVKLLPPQALLARLQHRLNLPVVARDLPARQQTLRDAIAWSHDLLDASDRRLMARVSVFVSGCTLDAAETVCGPATELGRDVLDGLAALADQSLLRQEEVGGEPRFVMLETIREFALEHLDASGEAEEIRRRHALAFLALAEQAEPHLLGVEGVSWLDRLEHEHDNLRAAVTWAIERGQAEISMRLGAALWRFWQMRGHLREARERLTAILAVPGAVAHREAYARTLEAAGGIAYWQSDFATAGRFYGEHLMIQRETGDALGIARALYNLAFVYVVPQTDLEKGRALLEESRAIYEQAGDQAGTAKAQWNLASVAYALGDYETAIQQLNICIPIFRALKDQFSLGWGLHTFGVTLIKTGDYSAARAALNEGLILFAEAHDLSGIVGMLHDLCSLALQEGDLERAARLAGGAAALQQSSGVDLMALFDATEGSWRPSDRELDKQALAAFVDEGRAMPLDQIVAYALQKSQRP